MSKIKITKLLALPLIALIRVYQFLISPLLGQRCRFHPSCSTYTKTALERFGIFKGLYLGTKRILKCHPLHPGGIDDVPEQKQTRR